MKPLYADATPIFAQCLFDMLNNPGPPFHQDALVYTTLRHRRYSSIEFLFSDEYPEISHQFPASVLVRFTSPDEPYLKKEVTISLQRTSFLKDSGQSLSSWLVTHRLIDSTSSYLFFASKSNAYTVRDCLSLPMSRLAFTKSTLANCMVFRCLRLTFFFFSPSIYPMSRNIFETRPEVTHSFGFIGAHARDSFFVISLAINVLKPPPSRGARGLKCSLLRLSRVLD